MKHSILANRLKRLEAKKAKQRETKKAQDIFKDDTEATEALKYLTMRELDRVTVLEERALGSGDALKPDEVQAYLIVLDDRIESRRSAPYAAAILNLLKEEYLLGSLELLPEKFPGFRAPRFPVIQAILDEAANLSQQVAWNELFPEGPTGTESGWGSTSPKLIE